MAELSIEEYKKLAEEFLEKYKKLDYIASGQRATDELDKTDPMRVNPGLEEVFGNPEAELAQDKLIKEYQAKGLDASRVAYLNDTTPPDTLNTEAFNKAEKAYEDRMADMAAREPTQAELDRAYGKRDGLNYFGDERPEKQIAYQDMPDSGESFKPEYLNQEIEAKNNLPKGSISKLGAVLDPISEGLEAGLRAIGLGSVATWWVKAEAANFLAGILRAGEGGLAQAQLGQSAALMGEKDIVSQTEENILKTAENIFAQNMKLSPGMWLETKYAESKLGKGKTPTEQVFSMIKGLGK